MFVVGVSAVWASGQDQAVQSWVAGIWGSIYLVLMAISDWNQKYYSNQG
jgi:hypothetical protein